MHRLLVPFYLVTALGLNAQSGVDPANLDRSVKPCEDFYRFANGSWLKNNPIPAEYATWGSFNQLQEQNNEKIKAILEEAAADKNAPAGSIRKKIGDFYASGMDMEAINRMGATPLKPQFDEIAAVASVKEFPVLLADLHDFGANAVFRWSAGQDAKNSTEVVAQSGAGGLGLPDRDYYTKTDEASKKIRDQYLAHVTKMLTLLGDAPEIAAKEAAAVLAIETQLAEASLTKVARRDPDATYHKMSFAEVSALTPSFDLAAYFTARGVAVPEVACVSQPAFLKNFESMLGSVAVEDWRAYFRWQLLRAHASELSVPFVEEGFAFNGKILTGAQEILPRWKQVLGTAEGALGEPTGQLFVEKYFPPQSKQRVLAMVDLIRGSLRTRIEGLDWMGEETKAAALLKLEKMTVKIGYPDKWKDYSSLEIDRGSYLMNCIRADQFDIRENFAKIGKPVNRDEWVMTPQKVNAYYRSNLNEIVFPAGILQPPFFNADADDAVNFGAIGAVIGHELTHGFDDQGRKFDAHGNLKSWWTDTDMQNFNQRAAKVISLYGSFKIIGETMLNGELTQGENIADIGGVRIAWTALQEQWKANGKPEPIDGFTAEQRFFLGWAQSWRINIRDEALRLRVATDPHSPGPQRVNGVLFNMPEFYEAFGCESVPEASERAEIW